MANVTNVKIYRTESSGKQQKSQQKAWVDVTFDNQFVVHGLKVMEGEKGLWVTMPSRKNSNGEFKDVFHPITKEAREMLIDSILAEYKKIDPSASRSPPPSDSNEEESLGDNEN